MKCLYSYSHPDAPQESFGVFTANPLSVENVVGSYVSIGLKGDLVQARQIEFSQFTLITDNQEAVKDFESTSVYSGFNPFHNLD